jgi:hypothetical protein
MPTVAELLVQARPILFSGQQIARIRSGDKVETRRVCRHLTPGAAYRIAGPHLVNGQPTVQWSAFPEAGEAVHLNCPYGRVGGLLWVKEIFATRFDQEAKTVRIRYTADGRDGPLHVVPAQYVPPKYWTQAYVTRNARYMPGWATRLVLQVTGLRLESVQEITTQGAFAEGCPDVLVDQVPCGWYRELWDKINAGRGYAWATDPWVWPITFRMVFDATKEVQ